MTRVLLPLLGLMSALNPGPLATHITAVGYIGRDRQDRRRVSLNGLLYTSGRTITYTSLGAVLYLGASVFEVASLFRGWGEKLLGARLIVVGRAGAETGHVRTVAMGIVFERWFAESHPWLSFLPGLI